jgi:hypothetical protein
MTGKPYHDGAPIYQAKGWTGILPLPPGEKSSPPKSYTGWHGKDPTDAMIKTWLSETVGDFQAASNIALRAPRNVVGIDIDQTATRSDRTRSVILRKPFAHCRLHTSAPPGRTASRAFGGFASIPMCRSPGLPVRAKTSNSSTSGTATERSGRRSTRTQKSRTSGMTMLGY